MTSNATHFKHFLNDHAALLIAASPEKKLDTFSAGIALTHICARLEKQTKLFFPEARPERLSFLDLKQGHNDGKLATPKAIIALGSFGTNMLNQIGPWRAIPDLPILHITTKTHPNLKEFGPIKLPTALAICDTSACSISEIIARITKEIDEELLTEPVATSLLAGIIAASNNFQSAALHPQTLFTAAYLISKNADNEKIVRHLYKTKPLPLVKLWGATIATFSYRERSKIGWSILSAQNFLISGANETHVIPILNELKANFAQAGLFVLGFDIPQRGAFALIHALKKDRLFNYARHKNTLIQNNTVLVPLAVREKIDINRATLTVVEELERFL